MLNKLKKKKSKVKKKTKKKGVDWFCSLRKKRSVVSLAKNFLDGAGTAA